jgi:hypothetical protein
MGTQQQRALELDLSGALLGEAEKTTWARDNRQLNPLSSPLTNSSDSGSHTVAAKAAHTADAFS